MFFSVLISSEQLKKNKTGIEVMTGIEAMAYLTCSFMIGPHTSHIPPRYLCVHLCFHESGSFISQPFLNKHDKKELAKLFPFSFSYQRLPCFIKEVEKNDIIIK